VFTVEVDVVRVRHLWPRSLVPPPLTDADKAYYSDAVRAETQRPEQRLDIRYAPVDTSISQHDAAALSRDTTRLY
jgi:membrane protein